MIRIRECLETEVGLLNEIEERADEIFPVGLIPQDAENYPLVYLERARRFGSLLVACEDKEIVGFAVAEARADAYHLFLIAVLPSRGRQGIGSALLERIADDAINKGMQRLTLTTFSHIEWNAPYYKKKGFEVIQDADKSAHLDEILKAEAVEGFTNRVAMQRML